MTRQFETPQGLCRFGLSRCDITPPVGIYHRMWGAAKHDRSTGVHRPLTATAMVFRPFETEGETGATDGPSEQILIAVDHCLFGAREMQMLLDAVCQRNHLQREQVIMQFSHTHAAGLLGYERQSLPGGDLIPPYLDELAQKLAAIVGEARQRAQPATITYGTGRCSLGRHRDFYDADSGQWVCGFNPDGQADDRVLIARVTDEQHRPMAVIVNYGCHPTTLAWENTLISPDFPGAMREVVERETGATCVFLQGASGDVGPWEGFVGETDVADRNGRQLGFAVLAALEGMPPPRTRYVYEGPVVSGATIGVWKHRPLDEALLRALQNYRIERFTVDLPYPADQPTLEQVEAERADWQRKEQEARQRNDEQTARDCRAMVERRTRRLTRLRNLPGGDCFPYPVGIWQIGKALWVVVEGEPYQQLQTALRERFPNVPLLVMVLANGSRCWYLSPAENYGQGIYQEATAVLAPGCLETLIEAVGERIAGIVSGE